MKCIIIRWVMQELTIRGGDRQSWLNSGWTDLHIRLQLLHPDHA